MTTTVNNLLSENDAAFDNKQNRKKIPGGLDDTNSQTSEPMNNYKHKTN